VVLSQVKMTVRLTLAVLLQTCVMTAVILVRLFTAKALGYDVKVAGPVWGGIVGVAASRLAWPDRLRRWVRG